MVNRGRSEKRTSINEVVIETKSNAAAKRRELFRSTGLLFSATLKVEMCHDQLLCAVDLVKEMGLKLENCGDGLLQFTEEGWLQQRWVYFCRWFIDQVVGVRGSVNLSAKINSRDLQNNASVA